MLLAFVIALGCNSYTSVVTIDSKEYAYILEQINCNN